MLKNLEELNINDHPVIDSNCFSSFPKLKKLSIANNASIVPKDLLFLQNLRFILISDENLIPTLKKLPYLLTIVVKGGGGWQRKREKRIELFETSFLRRELDYESKIEDSQLLQVILD